MNSSNENLKKYYLRQLGIQRWELRKRSEVNTLNLLSQKVASCTSCILHKTRTQTVFARGNPQAKVMVIGEAPGFHEDQQGLPFVGKAGGLLDKMLACIGLTQEDVYIANVIKCRPPNNRDPEKAEIEACSNYLAEQITLINPQCILAVGRFSGQFLIQQQMPMHKMRNQVFTYKEKPVLVTFHPAYLLRNPNDKKKAFQDLIRLKSLMSNEKKT
ncbi:bacteriophage-like DNA polymerase [Legionella adelaidensis]|uniref:Type-4 uracil-DNA glycosylase n=1 Tax=Legionella adelaidensis TaxID=45056 RepID=A0A0W0R5B0_9GAMM|nr:uracil-DNA glycosylase [Legionella adelaidensis]KTC66215.1 bacteriophage-like DNA polymerase [Legionella adelaidensis]